MTYRFAQEALTNAFRHSRANHIEVTLTYENASAIGNVRDPRWRGSVFAYPTTAGHPARYDAGHGVTGHARTRSRMGGSVATAVARTGALYSRRGSMFPGRNPTSSGIRAGSMWNK